LFEGDLTIHDFGNDAIAVRKLTVEEAQRQRIDDLLLQGALERPGAVHGIVAEMRQQRLRAIGELEGDPALGKAARQPAQLNLNDSLDVLERKVLEDDDFVDAVQE